MAIDPAVGVGRDAPHPSSDKSSRALQDGLMSAHGSKPGDAMNALGMRAFTLPPAIPGALVDMPLAVRLLLLAPAAWVAAESALTYSVEQRISRARMRANASRDP